MLLCLLLCYQHASAQEAQTLARKFFNSKGITQIDLDLVLFEGGNIEVYESKEVECFAAFSKNKNGFSLIGYSLENVFSSLENSDSLGQLLMHEYKPSRRRKSFQFDQVHILDQNGH